MTSLTYGLKNFLPQLSQLSQLNIIVLTQNLDIIFNFNSKKFVKTLSSVLTLLSIFHKCFSPENLPTKH